MHTWYRGEYPGGHPRGRVIYRSYPTASPKGVLGNLGNLGVGVIGVRVSESATSFAFAPQS